MYRSLSTSGLISLTHILRILETTRKIKDLPPFSENSRPTQNLELQNKEDSFDDSSEQISVQNPDPEEVFNFSDTENPADILQNSKLTENSQDFSENSFEPEPESQNFDPESDHESKNSHEIDLRQNKNSFVFGNSSDEEPEGEMNTDDEAAIDDSFVGRDNFNYAAVRKRIQDQDTMKL